MRNQKAADIFNDYQADLNSLENLFFNTYGYYPMYETETFWNEKETQRIETLCELWWELREVFAGRTAL